MALISRTIATIFSYVAAVALVGVVAVLIANVAMRLVASPLNGTYELVSMLNVVVIGLALADTQLYKSNVSMDLVVRRLPRSGQYLTGLITVVASLIMFVLLAWGLWNYGMTRLTQGAATESLGIPIWPSVIILVIGVAGLVVVFLADLDGFRKEWRNPGRDLTGLW